MLVIYEGITRQNPRKSPIFTKFFYGCGRSPLRLLARKGAALGWDPARRRLRDHVVPPRRSPVLAGARRCRLATPTSSSIGELIPGGVYPEPHGQPGLLCLPSEGWGSRDPHPGPTAFPPPSERPPKRPSSLQLRRICRRWQLLPGGQPRVCFLLSQQTRVLPHVQSIF